MGMMHSHFLMSCLEQVKILERNNGFRRVRTYSRPSKTTLLLHKANKSICRPWSNREAVVDDLVSIHLQPSKKSTLKGKGAEKLKPQFYGPYRVIRCVGEVAYELELPNGRKIHNIFHVSCLKKATGKNIAANMDLPPIDDEGHLIFQPDAILDTQERELRNWVIKEYVIRWRNLPDEDATWEGENILQHPSLLLLEEKKILGGEDCNIPN